ncbi:tetratricopeptide repeat protein [Arcobacter defluvii]|uniref:Tetratricopeptide repeat protein n=1 Tax=Arcobacter defluvii TaxID=873191 RepID=A0AAE7E6U3_9BACT|nr:tetratricopeptide repeat protein [Arcobacter defluvii]QKF78275.1 tetratricopeptide repeat protein [Arcobacter defluvii]RXI28978.1 hypothetical protein CP964_14460 [Arcobacter defluvii]
MKKQIVKTITFLGIFFSSNLFAITPPTPEEYKEIVDSFKLIDTSKKELSRTYKINGETIKAELEKQDDTKTTQFIQHIITLGSRILGKPNDWVLTNKDDQKPLFVSCISSDKKIVLSSLVRSSTYYQKTKEKFVRYSGFVAKIDKNTCCGNYWIDSGLLNGENPTAKTSIPTYKPNEFYPYFNEQRILERLYETGTCDKKATNEANIEVLLGNKWIPQEQSWDIKEKIATTILTLNQLLENAKSNQKLTFEQINEVLKNEELNIKTLQKYNDLAYYLQLSNKNKEAIFILEKIIEKFPNRTVAYLNLADAYNGLNNKDNAKQNYKKYIELMKLDNKKSKIPIRVFEHLNVFKSNETIREK